MYLRVYWYESTCACMQVPAWCGGLRSRWSRSYRKEVRPLDVSAGNCIQILWRKSESPGCWTAPQTRPLDILTVVSNISKTLVGLTSLSEGPQTTKIPIVDPLVTQAVCLPFPRSAPHCLPPGALFLSHCLLFLPWNSQARRNVHLPVSPPHSHQSNQRTDWTGPHILTLSDSKWKRNRGHRRHFLKTELLFHFQWSDHIRI